MKLTQSSPLARRKGGTHSDLYVGEVGAEVHELGNISSAQVHDTIVPKLPNFISILCVAFPISLRILNFLR